MVDQITPFGAPSGLMVAAQVGYEVYDPNDSAAVPKEIIAWLVTVVSGKNVTWPITTEGDPPTGWLLRYRNEITPPAAP